MSLRLTDHLTPAFGSETERAIDRTRPGMAHFAGSGPDGRVCRECLKWNHKGDYYARSGTHGGRIKDSPCKKFTELMRGEIGKAVPANSAACKYFEENTSPPSLFKRG